MKYLKKHSENIYLFTVFDSYEEVLKNISTFMYGRQYLYCLELVDDAVKIGFTANLKGRLRTHLTDKNSPFKDKVKRIGVLGPIRDGLNSEEIIHGYMTPYVCYDYGTSVETYSLKELFNTFKYKEKNSFELFNDTIMPMIQSLCETREENPFKLIMEDNTYVDKKEVMAETTVI